MNTIGSIKGRCLLEQPKNCQRVKKKLLYTVESFMLPKGCGGAVCSGNGKSPVPMNIVDRILVKPLEGGGGGGE